MASEKVVAQGSKLQIQTGGNYVDIPAVFSIDGPSSTRAKIDFSDLLSEWKEKRKGQKDGGEITFKVNYAPGDAVHRALWTEWKSKDPSKFKLTYSDTSASTETFDANVNEFKKTGFEVDGKIEAEVKIDITGEIVTT